MWSTDGNNILANDIDEVHHHDLHHYCDDYIFFDKVFTSMVRLSDQGNKCYDHDYGVDHQHDGNEYKFDVEQGWLDYLKKDNICHNQLCLHYPMCLSSSGQ